MKNSDLRIAVFVWVVYSSLKARCSEFALGNRVGGRLYCKFPCGVIWRKRNLLVPPRY